MGLRKISVTDSYFGTHDVSFITASSSLSSDILQDQDVDSWGDAQLLIDTMMGDTLWNFVQGVYNNPISPVLESSGIATDFYPTIQSLSSTYSENTTLYSSITIGDTTLSSTGSVGWDSAGCYISGYIDTFLYSYLYLFNDGSYGYSSQCNISLPVIYEDNINSDGSLNISSGDTYGRLLIQIHDTGTQKGFNARYTKDYGTFTATDITNFDGVSTEEVLPSDDPYSGDDASDDPSGAGGGPSGSDQDNWDADSDEIPVPDLPTISAVDTGFITLYCPTSEQLQNLASYLWTGLFDIDTYRKIMADPMDTILGLSIVPVSVPSSDTQDVTVGNIPTGIYLTKADAQFVEVDCGTITLSEIWHSYLTYSPYCRMSIMLPFIGAQELDADQIIGASGGLGVVYHIDILSGACVAYITINGNVIAQFAGQCAISIPISASDFTNTITSLCTLVATGIGVVASGGMSAPVQSAAVGGLATAVANTASNVISAKPTFAKSGNISGSNGLMAIQYPYLILERPKLCAPANQNEFMGYPSYITNYLSSLSGFTQVQDILLDGIGCTDSERNEILSLLRNGVIL